MAIIKNPLIIIKGGEESIIKNNIELMKIADIVGNNLDGGEFATDDEYIEAEEKFQTIASRIMGVEI